MSTLSYLHQLFNIDQYHPYIHTLRWQDRSLQCPRCQSQDVDPWGTYHYPPGCKRYWYTAASVPSLISPRPCSIVASGRCRAGFWRRFSSVSRVRRGVLPESWVSMVGPATALVLVAPECGPIL